MVNGNTYIYVSPAPLRWCTQYVPYGFALFALFAVSQSIKVSCSALCLVVFTCFCALIYVGVEGSKYEYYEIACPLQGTAITQNSVDDCLVSFEKSESVFMCTTAHRTFGYLVPTYKYIISTTYTLDSV